MIFIPFLNDEAPLENKEKLLKELKEYFKVKENCRDDWISNDLQFICYKLISLHWNPN